MSIDRNKVLEAAQKHLAKGNLDKAIAEFQRLVAADPKDVRTLLKIAELQAKKGSTREAVDTYLKVGDSYASAGFFSKSVAVYKQAVRLDPTRLDALTKLAQNYEELQHTADALAAYDMLAQAYLGQNQTDGALSAMQRATEIDPTNLAARIRYAEALSRAGKTKDAAEEFEKGARLIKQQGRMDDYIKVAERLLFHRETDLEVARELAALYLDRNDGKRALAKLQMLFKANPKDEGVLGMLAQAFVSLDQRDKAVQVLKELAKNHLEARRPEERAQALRRILELDPNDADAKQALSGNAPPPRPRVNIDDVVPANAVIGGGGRPGVAAGPRPPNAATTAAASPASSVNRAPAPSVPRPGGGSYSPSQSNLARPALPPVPSTPRAAAPPATPPPHLRPAPAPAPAPAIELDEFDADIDTDSDEIIIVDDEPQSIPPPAARAPEPLHVPIAGRGLRADEPTRLSATPPGPAASFGVPATSAAPVAAQSQSLPQPSAQPHAPASSPGSPRPQVPPGTDEASREAMVGRLLAECDVFARYGLRARIIEQLEKVAELAPEHRVVRERLRDVYLEEGRTDDAIEQILALAEITRDSDPSYAILVLRQALSYDDENPDVRRALRTLDPNASPGRTSAPLIETNGFDVEPAPDPGFEDDGVLFVDDGSPPTIQPPELDPFDDGPSGGMREPSQLTGKSTTPPPASPEPAPLPRIPTSGLAPLGRNPSSAALPAVLGFDDDFDDAPPAAPPETLLAAPAATVASVAAPMLPPAPEPLPEPELADIDLDDPISPEEFERAPAAEAAPPHADVPRAAPASLAIEEILDETDFYLAQGLFEEARDTLTDALALSPSHPLLLDKLADVEDAEAEANAGGGATFVETPAEGAYDAATTDAEPAEEPAYVPSSGGAVTTPPGASEDDDDAFALAERLAEALDQEVGPAGATSVGADTIDVDQVFAQFKRGIEQQIDESDCETHYDLGIAYKEMGLLEDAVSEFEISAKNIGKSSIALTMIGLCRVEQGQVAEGILALERALAAPHRDEREELGLWYELGIALALAGRNAEAIAYYERVKIAEPSFRGVSDRIAQLRALTPPASGSAELSEQDELERAFDELITG